MQTELSIEIDRPIDDVFDYATNKVAEWSIIVVEDEVIEQKPEGVGTTFRNVCEERGRRMEFDGVVTRHEPPTASAVHLKGQQFDIETEFLFEDLSGRTRVTQRSTVRPKGFFTVMFFLMGWLMKRSGCKAQENELNSLKQKLEAKASPASQ